MYNCVAYCQRSINLMCYSVSNIFSLIRYCNFYLFLITAHYFYSYFVRDNEEKLLKELYQRCNRTLRFIQNENLIPPDCYYRMKWRHVDNQDTLEFNRKSLSNLGMKLHVWYTRLEWNLKIKAWTSYSINWQVILLDEIRVWWFVFLRNSNSIKREILEIFVPKLGKMVPKLTLKTQKIHSHWTRYIFKLKVLKLN